MTASPKKPFEYGQLSADQAAKAKASAERIRQSARRHIIDVGLELIQMELLLGHGHYEASVLSELPFSLSSARNYKAAAREFGDKPLTVSALPLAVLYRLAGAAEAVREAIVARIEAGERVGIEEIRAAVRKPKALAKSAATLQTDKTTETVSTEQGDNYSPFLAKAFVQRLRAHFELDAIARLNRHWRDAGFRAIEEAIAQERGA